MAKVVRRIIFTVLAILLILFNVISLSGTVQSDIDDLDNHIPVNFQ